MKPPYRDEYDNVHQPIGNTGAEVVFKKDKNLLITLICEDYDLVKQVIGITKLKYGEDVNIKITNNGFGQILVRVYIPQKL